MNTKIYVGNIEFSADEDALKIHFENYAEVKVVKILRDPETGRSKGFGFVTVNSEHSEYVIANAHRSEFINRKLNVKIAKQNKSQGTSKGKN